MSERAINKKLIWIWSGISLLLYLLMLAGVEVCQLAWAFCVGAQGIVGLVMMDFRRHRPTGTILAGAAALMATIGVPVCSSVRPSYMYNRPAPDADTTQTFQR